MGRTPLHYAATNGQLSTLLLLLKLGANINAQTNVPLITKLYDIGRRNSAYESNRVRTYKYREDVAVLEL